ncbi:unnamed protein product [Scytosiphon promiscuus]
MVRAMVRLVKTKNCFVNLPPHVARSFSGAAEGAVILRLSWETGAETPTSPSWAFASWNGGLSDADSGAIEIPLALARVVGLAAALDSDTYLSVRVDPAGFVPTASRVCLEPLSSDDWEILEANAEHLEGQMLTQVCVASPGQVMPIWVHDTSLIALQVVSAEALGGGAAATCVRLTAETEVAVAPKPRRRRRSREGEERERRFRPSGLLRVAPPLRRLGSDRAGVCGSSGRPYLLMHPTTLAGIEGWNSSRSCRAPWTPLSAVDYSGAPPATSAPPDEALAVLWRDESYAGPSGDVGREAGAFRTFGAIGGAAAAASRAGGGGRSGIVSQETAAGTLGTAAATGAGGGSVGDGASGPAAGTRRGRAQGAGVVVILREDARVPPGHIAEAESRAGKGAELWERAGLTVVRRSARVRVLAATESPVASPRLTFSKMVSRNDTAPSGSFIAATAARKVGDSAAPSAAGSSASQDMLRRGLAYAWARSGTSAGVFGTDVGSGSCSQTLANGGSGAVGCAGGRVGAGPDRTFARNSSGGGGQERQPQERDPRWPRSRSGSGLLQLASSTFFPLVLDEGAVVSLPILAAPPPLLQLPSSPSGYTHSFNGDGNACGGNARGACRPSPCTPTATVDFVVGISSEEPSAIPGFPLRTEATSAGTAVTGPGEGGADTSGAAASTSVRYAVLASQGDIDRAIAGALVGPDVFAGVSQVHGAAVAVEEAVGEAGKGRGALGGVEEQMKAISNLLAPVLVRPVAAARARLGVPPAATGTVVHGAAGSGKTALALATARRLRESYSSMAGTEVVMCRDLQGRKMGDVLGALEEAFRSASRHAPSLVVLDDLDKIAPAEGEEGAGAFNAQAARIAERLQDLLSEVAGKVATAPVGVVATAASVAALHPRLTRSGMLDAQVEIPPPKPAARASILQSLVRGLGAPLPASYNRPAYAFSRAREPPNVDGTAARAGGGGSGDDVVEDDSIDWEYLSSKTEGCQARDLAKLVKRALLHSALRRMKEAETEVSSTAAFAAPHVRLEYPNCPQNSSPLPPSQAVVNGTTISAGVGHGGYGREASSGHGKSAAVDSAIATSVVNGGHDALRDSDVVSAGADGRPSPITTVESGGGFGARGGSIISSIDMSQGVGGIEMEDLEAALEGFSAESLRGAGLFRSSVEWGDVGGLSGVRAELREILELPVKYGRLFEATPTRLPTGALLYGPPGCGKTLLAGAVAAECGLNFISVKGPEVLDKYIGASEQAIRSLFARAASAAPCVLFFDEFEAVAPRRGNDNTGVRLVTDRVVNQLLTFLDGVEGRDGVYVLGATSRPDLIDSALLRPGRLDRQLYCGFPDEAEREDILRAVCRKTPLSSEARDEALARVARSPKAQAFTGADLQAIIDTAQLAAIHSYLERAQAHPGGSGVESRAGEGRGGGKSSSRSSRTERTQGMLLNGDGDDNGGGNISGSTGSSAGARAEAHPSLTGEMAAENGKKVEPRVTFANGKCAPGGGSRDSKSRSKSAGETMVHAPPERLSREGETSGARDHPNSSDGSSSSIRTEKDGVEISADNVWDAFLSTRPSLSREDRARYDSAYTKFRGGSRPADFNPISSVDDGTLRTALK